MAGGSSSDSGLPPPPPSRPAGQWQFGEECLPSQRRDRPGFTPDSLTARLSWPSLSWPRDASITAFCSLGARRRLGDGDLRPVLNSSPFVGARHLGRGSSEGRAYHRV